MCVEVCDERASFSEIDRSSLDDGEEVGTSRYQVLPPPLIHPQIKKSESWKKKKEG